MPKEIAQLDGRDIDFAFADIRQEIMNLYEITLEYNDVKVIPFHVQLKDDTLYLITDKEDHVNERYKGSVVTNAIRHDDSPRIVNNMALMIVEQLIAKEKCEADFSDLDDTNEPEKIKEILDKMSDDIGN